MANDMAISEFKNELIKQIQNDDQIIQALAINEDEDSEDLAYVRLFPYYFIVPTQEDAKTYIFIEVGLTAIQDRFDALKNDIVYDKCTIYIYVVAHQSLMRMETAGMSAVRIDYISQLLNKKFNGKRIAGLGTLQRVSNIPRSINDTYRSREMVFEVLDFNKEMCSRD
jgi:hypothetical protein